jgi:hypothetical protein
VQSNAPGSTYNGLNAVYVGKSVDGGVTWKDTKVFEVNPASQRELNMLFPVVTSDAAGNLYAAWADTYKVEYSVSTDHGAHWSKPMQVNRDNRGVGPHGSDKPDAGKADVFPWIAGGGKGLLDVVWYHGAGGAAKSNQVYRDPGDSKTRWTVAFAQLRNADRVSRGRPQPTTLDYTEAITPVIHVGDICQNGTFCSLVPVPGAPFSSGDRSLLDFFQVAIDKEGRANLAIADNGKAPGQLFSAFTQQLSGYSVTTGRKLRSLKIRYATANCNSVGTFTDKGGDATSLALTDPGVASQDGLDLRTGWVTWDAAKQVATFHLKITDLSANPPAGATGQIFRFYFGWDNKGYGVEADRDVTTGTSFSLISHGTGLPSTIYDGLKGSFDDKHNEVRVNVPAAVFTKSTDPAFKSVPLKNGGQINGLAGESRRSYPAALAPVTDTATGQCPALLSGGRRAAALTGFLPAAPQVPTGTSDVLPGVAAAVVFGCAAAVTASRRRYPLAV